MVKPTTVVIVPTYNEADNIDDLVAQLLALPIKIGIIVVDDNSPDGTGALADAWHTKFPAQVSVVHRAGKLGLGTAYIAGFKHALAMPGVDRIMSMDADFSHHPRYVPSMIALSETKHVVIGSRYVPGGGTRYCTRKRIALSRISNLVARKALGLRATDATAGFRLYYADVLRSIPLDDIKSNGYSFLVDMLFMVQRRGWQIGEVPIVFEDRRRGQTKISRHEVYKAIGTIGRLFVRRISGNEPIQPPISLPS